MNIQFEYLYRDSGNYKNWGQLVFANPQNISVESLKRKAAKFLIEQLYFVAEKARIPDLHFDEFDTAVDHAWHEYYSFEPTNTLPTDALDRSIDQFLVDLRSAV